MGGGDFPKRNGQLCPLAWTQQWMFDGRRTILSCMQARHTVMLGAEANEPLRALMRPAGIRLFLALVVVMVLCPWRSDAATSRVTDDDGTIPAAPGPAGDMGPIRRDTLSGTAHRGPLSTDSTGMPPHRVVQRKSTFLRSPTGMLLRSVAVPGWGQWSNGKKQKAAIYFGIETYFFTKALIWRHRTLDRLHTWERTGQVADFSPYNSARDRRNYFYWLTGVTAFVSMFDAYADAYLLTLERTRGMGDDFWGGQALRTPEDEVRLVVSLRF